MQSISSRYLVILNCFSCLFLSVCSIADADQVTLDDGTMQSVGSVTSDRFLLRNTIGATPPTTLNIASGAEITAGVGLFEHAVEATDNSVVNVFGGTLTGGNSSAAILGRGNSVINIFGGHLVNNDNFDVALATSENATLNIFGGTIAGGTGLGARGIDVAGGVTNIFGGTITASRGASLDILNDATVNLHGGSIDGNGIEFFEGVLNVFGTSFLLDGNPIGPGTLTGGNNNAGALSVTFADGSQTAFFFGGATNAGNRLNLIAVPEASSFMILALASSVGMFMRSRRKGTKEPSIKNCRLSLGASMALADTPTNRHHVGQPL